MSFTKWDKHCLVQRILEDLPQEDYKALTDQRVGEICIERMPDQIKRIWARTDLRHHLTCGRIYYCCYGSPTPGFSSEGNDALHEAIQADERFRELHRLHDEQKAVLDELRRKLVRSFTPIRSAKAFGEQFPELVKYLAVQEQEVVNLPVSTEVIDSLKAAGLKIEVDSPQPAT